MVIRIAVGMVCRVEDVPGLYVVKGWEKLKREFLVYLSGLDEYGLMLCSIDPSGMVAVSRKHVRLTTDLGETLWN